MDANYQTGGITNGHDLIAEYLRENYPTPLVNAVLAMADVGGRSIAYETPAVGDTGVFLWQVLRALPGYMLKIGKGWLGLVL